MIIHLLFKNHFILLAFEFKHIAKLFDDCYWATVIELIWLSQCNKLIFLVKIIYAISLGPSTKPITITMKILT